MLTRREFTRLAMAGAASQVVSPLLAQGSDRKIGYCIIGLGRISMDHFMPATLTSKNSRVTGLVSGHREKALAQAAKYGVPESSIYTYETWTRSRTTLRSTQCTWRCPTACMPSTPSAPRGAGKHVLCEKPMATIGGGFASNDQGLQRREQEADDCLSLPHTNRPTSARCSSSAKASWERSRRSRAPTVSTKGPANGGLTASWPAAAR